jgi:hypothetical protein
MTYNHSEMMADSEVINVTAVQLKRCTSETKKTLQNPSEGFSFKTIDN